MNKNRGALKQVQQGGQSMLEMLIVMPLVVFVGFALIQLLWLFLAQQMLQTATVFVTRQSSLDGGNMVRQMETLYRRMEPLPGKAVHVPLVIRLQPNSEYVRRYGEDIIKDGQRYLRLSTDFPLVRLDNMRFDERQHWLRSRIVQYEVVWCQPLRVPVAAPIMAYFLRYTLDDKQQYCNLQGAGREPMKAISARAAAPLVAPLEIYWRDLVTHDGVNLD